MDQNTQTTDVVTVKRGRGRPRKNPLNYIRFARTRGFAEGIAASLSNTPIENANLLQHLGSAFATWHQNTFTAPPPAAPVKGNWLRNFKPFTDAFEAAEAAGVFNLTVQEWHAAAVLQDNEDVVAAPLPTEEQTENEQDNHIDLSLLTPVEVAPVVPVRGPGGRFLSKAEREALSAEHPVAT